MYWERPGGAPRAPYLDLCEETIRHHLDGMAFEVVDERSAFDWVPTLSRQVWHALPDAMRRSDYLRVRLLHAHGGVYLDVDCIALASLRLLTEPLASATFASFGAADQAVQNGFFAARPGSPLLEAWAEAQDRFLVDADDWSSLPRTALGEPLATELAAVFPHHSFPERVIAPVMWYEWGRFFSRCASPADVLRFSPLTVMLYNEFMGEYLRNASRSELLTGRTLLSRLFRVALGISTPGDEEDGWTKLHLLADVRYSTYGRAARSRIRSARGRFTLANRTDR